MKTDWSNSEMVKGIHRIGERPHYYYLRRALKPENSILEVGCATGDLYRYLAQRRTPRYTGADLTSEMLDAFRRCCPGVACLECDVQAMSNVSPGAYDWVVCCDVLIHIPQPYEGLLNLWRSTRGAMLIVIRETDHSEDIVDLSRGYQVCNGVRYYYNVFNRKGMLTRLKSLHPAPQAIDSLVVPLNLAVLVNPPKLDLAPQESFYVTYYALLKDSSAANLLGQGETRHNHRNLVHRAWWKTRRTINLANRWDVV